MIADAHDATGYHLSPPLRHSYDQSKGTPEKEASGDVAKDSRLTGGESFDLVLRVPALLRLSSASCFSSSSFSR
jgi:hypothetical protein